jgi:hypothetical protein
MATAVPIRTNTRIAEQDRPIIAAMRTFFIAHLILPAGSPAGTHGQGL